jgi:hypothetical protein
MRRADPARKLGSISCEPIKIKQLFPLKINGFAVHDGEVHYCDFNKEPKAVRLHRRVLPALSFLRCVQMFTSRRPSHRASGPPRRRKRPMVSASAIRQVFCQEHNEPFRLLLDVYLIVTLNDLVFLPSP